MLRPFCQEGPLGPWSQVATPFPQLETSHSFAHSIRSQHSLNVYFRWR